jgi:hypothetical protein
MTLLRRLIEAFLRFLRALRGSRETEPAGIRRPVEMKHWQGKDRPPPLMWKDCHPRTRRTFKAELSCSHGHAISLRGHTISADGGVSPSVVCLSPGCGFHDYVRLKDWTGGPL